MSRALMLIHGEILGAAAEINARGLLMERIQVCACICGALAAQGRAAASPEMILEFNPVRWSVPQLPTSSWGFFLGC